MPKRNRKTRFKLRSDISTSSSSTNSEDFDFDLNLRLGFNFQVEMTPGFSKRSRTTSTRKRSSTNTNNRTSSKKCKIPSIITIDDSDEDENDRQTSAVEYNKLSKLVYNKVENFFKTGGLLSDDEEIQISKPKPKTPVVNLDQPSTSSSSVINLDDGTKHDNTLSEFEQIDRYCKETEEMIRNANEILEKFKGGNEENKTNKENELRNEENEPRKEENESKEENEPKKEENKTTKEKKIGDCPVCLEDLADKQVMTTKCGHLFCKECIETIVNNLKKCPSCRKPVNKRNVIQIFI